MPRPAGTPALPRRQPKCQWDVSWIVQNRLMQGGYPTPPGGAFQLCDTLVLCAEECQPKLVLPPGKRLVRAGIDDDSYRPLPKKHADMFISLSRELAAEAQAGRVVAITCFQGVNRSGLLTALTLMRLHRISAQQAIETIRLRRKPTRTDLTPLCNPMFEQLIRSLHVV